MHLVLDQPCPWQTHRWHLRVNKHKWHIIKRLLVVTGFGNLLWNMSLLSLILPRHRGQFIVTACSQESLNSDRPLCLLQPPTRELHLSASQPLPRGSLLKTLEWPCLCVCFPEDSPQLRGPYTSLIASAHTRPDCHPLLPQDPLLPCLSSFSKHHELQKAATMHTCSIVNCSRHCPCSTA